MGLNCKCPKCGSEKVQLSDSAKNHGCLWFLLFGLWYVIWVLFKWMIGVMIFVLYDWWMAIVKASKKKGFVWQSKKWFTGNRKYYYCHDCGYNFEA